MKPTSIYWKEIHKIVEVLNEEKSAYVRAQIAADWVSRKREQAYREARNMIKINISNLHLAGAKFVYNDVIMLLSPLSLCQEGF